MLFCYFESSSVQLRVIVNKVSNLTSKQNKGCILGLTIVGISNIDKGHFMTIYNHLLVCLAINPVMHSKTSNSTSLSPFGNEDVAAF